jgi:hypothetical protein
LNTDLTNLWAASHSKSDNVVHAQASFEELCERDIGGYQGEHKTIIFFGDEK